MVLRRNGQRLERRQTAASARTWAPRVEPEAYPGHDGRSSGDGERVPVCNSRSDRAGARSREPAGRQSPTRSLTGDCGEPTAVRPGPQLPRACPRRLRQRPADGRTRSRAGDMADGGTPIYRALHGARCSGAYRHITRWCSLALGRSWVSNDVALTRSSPPGCFTTSRPAS